MKWCFLFLLLCRALLIHSVVLGCVGMCNRRVLRCHHDRVCSRTNCDPTRANTYHPASPLASVSNAVSSASVSVCCLFLVCNVCSVLFCHLFLCPNFLSLSLSALILSRRALVLSLNAFIHSLIRISLSLARSLPRLSGSVVSVTMRFIRTLQ